MYSQPILLSTRSMHGLPKTGNQLLAIVKQEKEAMEQKYNVETVGWCTDDGPDGKKMRRLAALIWPQLVLIFCWAHQIKLICKAVSKASHCYKDTFTLASNVVKHVNNHDMVLTRGCEETAWANNGKSCVTIRTFVTRLNHCNRGITVMYPRLCRMTSCSFH